MCLPVPRRPLGRSALTSRPAPTPSKGALRKAAPAHEHSEPPGHHGPCRTRDPIALVAAGGLVYQASNAAFTGQTRNSGNEWSTGSVSLTDDDSGQARFQVANMLPGDTDTKCIKVTANASVPSLVKGYTVNPVTSAQGMENRIKVSIESGDGGTFADCTGFVVEGLPLASDVPLSALATKNTYEQGIGGWEVPAGVHAKTYRFTWKFDTTGMTQAQIDQLQGARTGIDVQWEMRTAGV